MTLPRDLTTYGAPYQDALPVENSWRVLVCTVWRSTWAAPLSTLSAWHDPLDGGFGRAPKFPQAAALELALRLHRDGRPGMLDVVTRFDDVDELQDQPARHQVGGTDTQDIASFQLGDEIAQG